MVFQRRPRQTQTMPGVDPAHDFCPLTAGVLDGLSLIKTEQVVGVPGQFLRVTPEQGIGGQNDVVLCNFGKTGLAFGTVQGQHGQAGRKAGGFAFPVEDQRGRQNNQRRTIQTPGFLFQQQMRQCLSRFAQTHIVSQNPGKAVFAQELEPGQPLLLIGAQLQLQSPRRCNGADTLGGRQALCQAHDVFLTTELPTAGVVQFAQAGSIKAGNT